jgi:hypothetical protein
MTVTVPEVLLKGVSKRFQGTGTEVLQGCESPH